MMESCAECDTFWIHEEIIKNEIFCVIFALVFFCGGAGGVLLGFGEWLFVSFGDFFVCCCCVVVLFGFVFFCFFDQLSFQ